MSCATNNEAVPAGDPRVLGRRVLGEGKWLLLEELRYRDRTGIERTWESASRKNDVSAACILARLAPSDRWVLVRQFRPPAGAYVIEFPAGLTDPGESPERAAVRELLEETGYEGRVVRVWPCALNTPGMTGECAWFVRVDVDEASPANRSPTPRPDEGEFVEVLLIDSDGLLTFLLERTRMGDRVDSKVLMFALGLAESAGKY